ncbi:MAG: DUF2786 domain-containing protein [Myxococcales bacterium]|nr:DUF2786 domain-containing protein [Myxococcales bacterium]
MNKIQKVRALLRLAHDQAGQPEGESARLHALQLMAKYGVTNEDLGDDSQLLIQLTTLDERAKTRPLTPDLSTMRIDTSLRVPDEPWKRNLMFVISQHVGLEIRVSTTTLMRADKPAAYERWKALYKSLTEKIDQAAMRLSRPYADNFCGEAVSALQQRIPGLSDDQVHKLRIDSTGYQPGRRIHLSVF